MALCSHEQALSCGIWWALTEVWTQECLLVLLGGLLKNRLIEQSVLAESAEASPCLVPPLLHTQISVGSTGCCVFLWLWQDSCWVLVLVAVFQPKQMYLYVTSTFDLIINTGVEMSLVMVS